MKPKLYLLICVLGGLMQVMNSVFAQNNNVYVHRIDWSRDGSTLAITTHEGLSIYDSTLQRIAFQLFPADITYKVQNAYLSPNGAFVVMGNQILDSRTLEPLSSIADAVDSNFAQWSHDSREIAFRNFEGRETRIYRAIDGQLLRVLSSVEWRRGYDYVWSPNGLYFSTLAGRNVLEILDAQDGKSLGQYQIETDDILSIVWGPYSTKLALLTTKLVAPGTLGSTPEPGAPDFSRIFSLLVLEISNGKIITDITKSLNRVAWHPDGTQIVATDQDGMLTIWDVETGSLVATYPVADGPIKSIQYSPYGGRLMLGFYSTLSAQSSFDTPVARLPIREESELGGLIQILVPAPSPELLTSIEAACVPAQAQTTLPAAETLLTEASSLTAYIAAVQADASIPPGCAADLIAVAEALQAERE